MLFADIVGFTALSARLPADEVVEILGRLFERFDELVAARGLEKIKTIGDAYMVAGGLPEPMDDHAARVVDLGLAMIDAARQEGDGIADLRLRVGAHSGPVIGGVIGHRKFAFDIWGETVNLASRLEFHGVPGLVHVSASTRRNLSDVFEVEPRGPMQLRGYGPMETFTIARRRASESQESAAQRGGSGDQDDRGPSRTGAAHHGACDIRRRLTAVGTVVQRVAADRRATRAVRIGCPAG